jgi:hypothetical protein
MSRIPTATTSSSNYQSIFDNAIEAYKKKTKKDLRSHPLLDKLEHCHSPDAVLKVLYEQIPDFDQSRGTDDKLTKWLDPTVNVLFTFSGVIGGGIGLASPRDLRVKFVPELICDRLAGIPTSCNDLHRNWGPFLSNLFFHPIYSGVYHDAKLSQAAKAVSDSQDALATVFECIENFFRRLETYVEVPPTVGMTDIIVKIMVEVLCILSIATKELKQSRASEWIPGGVSCPCRLTAV